MPRYDFLSILDNLDYKESDMFAPPDNDYECSPSAGMTPDQKAARLLELKQSLVRVKARKAGQHPGGR